VVLYIEKAIEKHDRYDITVKENDKMIPMEHADSVVE
jgi:hypothetical protein